MSTLKVTNIESPSGGGVNAKITDINGGQLSNRNLIINGAMQVSQRSTSTAVTTAGTFVLDRFTTGHGSSFNINSTISQSSTAAAGFSNSYKVDVTTVSTPVSGQNGLILTRIEAQNLQHLQYGASGAQTCTLSFWVRSNKTGTYCFQIVHADADKYQLYEYTISSADTWEQKTITIVGNTAAAIANDNGVGLELRWHLASGPNDHVPASSTWTGSSQGYFTTSNQVNLFDDTSNEWYLTGVQLEVGDVATAFEHRSFGDELTRCERYYQESSPRYIAAQYLITNEIAGQFVPFKPEMRATPSPTYASLSYRENTGSFTNSTLSSNATLNKNGINFVMNASGASTSDSFVIFMNDGEFEAEL